MKTRSRGTIAGIIFVLHFFAFACVTQAADARDKELRRENEIKEMQKDFTWWPTDAKPAPVKDETRGGSWWWPTQPGSSGPLWGNRGYVYLYKIIYDYKADELPAPTAGEERAALVVKKIIKNVKVYFDYDGAAVRDDAQKILRQAVATLKRNPEADILVTGNCDTRGSEAYNEKLGRRRAEAVREFMINNGVDAERVRIVSRGKLDAIAPVTDLVGMQKDRNAQFMIAEVEEVMVPFAGGEADVTAQTGEEKTVVMQEQLTGEIKVDTREYVVEKGDTLWKIAAKELGSGHRWKYLYELNKDRIKNPDKLRAGMRLTIPVE